MKNLTFLLLLVSCSHFKKPEPPAPKRIVLIQGVHLDDSSWQPVQSRLETQGYEVVTLGRIGRDRAPSVSLKEIASMSCDKIPTHSILVGHSYGGAIVNAMVGICPRKISQIIYVSAVVPLKGEKPFEHMSKADQIEYARAVDFKKGQIKPKNPYQFFKITDPTYTYHKRSAPPLYNESMDLVKEAIEYDEKEFDAIPKAYIYTLRDKVISLATQELFTSRTHIQRTAGVQTGHFPMMSNPESLTMDIVNLARPEKETAD